MRWWWAVCSRNTKGGGREGFGPQPATELPWLSCGRTVWNSGGGWCVGWHGGVYEVMIVVGGYALAKREAGGGGGGGGGGNAPAGGGGDGGGGGGGGGGVGGTY